MSAESSLVSIGMPVHNGEKYLRRSMDSLLAQEHDNFELIVSDNSSTDSTPNICRMYAKKDHRIRLFFQDQNHGPIANFAHVLEQSSGPYFMWAAHDDFRDRNFISALLEPMSVSKDLTLSCPRVVKVTPDLAVLSTHSFPETHGHSVLGRIRKLLWGAQSGWVYGLFRTSAIRSIYSRVSRTGLVWGTDHLIILQLLLNHSLTGTNEAAFYQMKTGQSAPTYKPKSLRANASFAKILISNAIEILLQSNLTIGHKAYLLPFLGLYLERQVFHIFDLKPARRFARRLFLRQ